MSYAKEQGHKIKNKKQSILLLWGGGESGSE